MTIPSRNEVDLSILMDSFNHVNSEANGLEQSLWKGFHNEFLYCMKNRNPITVDEDSDLTKHFLQYVSICYSGTDTSIMDIYFSTDGYFSIETQEYDDHQNRIEIKEDGHYQRALNLRNYFLESTIEEVEMKIIHDY